MKIIKYKDEDRFNRISWTNYFHNSEKISKQLVMENLLSQLTKK